MRVARLSATNYRNIEFLTIEPSDGVNIFYGDNAQGKTNLIEAIWQFTGARSFRGARDNELVRFGSKFYKEELVFTARGMENKASILFDGTKQATLGGVKLESPVKMAGEFCAVVFSPEHLDLVKSGPQIRRRFLDNAISEIWPRHTAALLKYRELLNQRNALLKDIPRHSELLDTLDIWDEHFSQMGASITNTRMRYLKRLEQKAAEHYSGIASKAAYDKPYENNESFSLQYINSEGEPFSSDEKDSHAATAALAVKIKTKLDIQRAADIESGYTHTGPHRDDLLIRVCGNSARMYASQGQQRSCVLAIKLAEAEVLREITGEAPVLLLDDVMSELDRDRQNYILNNIGGCQVFITCCDPSSFSSLNSGTLFEIKGGSLIIKN